MPKLMLNARSGHGRDPVGRNYNYQAMYEPDSKTEGPEAPEKANLWRVYLEEADAYDTHTGMVDNFRAILDSVLVLASLFSVVITTFIATRTSKVLRPDSAHAWKITASLLVETNQLLRAAGNATQIDAVDRSTLDPDSTIYTSKDVWVNGLFLTSLALSVTTALTTVLARQWIRAYIEVAPDDARTQDARIRQFRFDGLVKWKLGLITIIKGLPLILYSSVVIFLLGLSLDLARQ